MENQDKLLDALLENLPGSNEVEVLLPSENRVYKLEDESKPVTVRPLTFEDEKLISTSDSHDPTDLLLRRCVGNINTDELLGMDKLYLLLKIREISYGDDYDVTLFCKHCRAENPITVQLSQLNVNPVPDDFQEPVQHVLPKLGKKVSLRFPRSKDIKFADGDFADNLWRFVEAIEVEEGQEVTNKALIAKVVSQLPIVDIKTIIKLLRTDFGVDTNVVLQCKECGETSVHDLPIDANFFDVSL